MQKLINPSAEQLLTTPEEFLLHYQEAVMIYVEGEQCNRTRAIVTLLHGNEPSGLRAVHRWLLSGDKPLCNIICFVPAIPAAIYGELHQYRIYPEQRDMNRCFQPPYNDPPGKIAEEIIKQLHYYQPECVIDIHNTSGHSPDFGVVTYEDAIHEALVSLFTERLVITDLRLGSLMELSQPHAPVVTIECGGVDDAESDLIAWNGLQRYLYQEDVLELEHGHRLDLYHHPVRLELHKGTVLAYADSYVLGSDITIPRTLDQRNFGQVDEGTLIAWLGEKKGSKCLRVVDAGGEEHFNNFFTIKGNQLVTAQPLKLFMITTRPDIALSDCVLYAAAESEHSVIDT